MAQSKFYLFLILVSMAAFFVENRAYGDTHYMEKLYNEFKDKGFTILAIDMQEDADSVNVFKEKYKLNFPILLDSDGSVGQFYGVRSIPTTYLVDREGYLIGSALGARNWASESAFMLIKQLLKVSPKP